MQEAIAWFVVLGVVAAFIAWWSVLPFIGLFWLFGWIA